MQESFLDILLQKNVLVAVLISDAQLLSDLLDLLAVLSKILFLQ